VAALTPPDNFGALTVWQQQAYLNGDPNYKDATDPNTATTSTIQTHTQQLATSDNYVTISFGNAAETVWTLESYLSQWAAGAMTEPASLQGEDPVSAAAAIATERCAVIPTPDCANRAALAAQYGAQVKAAIANAPGVYAAPPKAAYTAPAITSTSPATAAPASPTPAPAPTPAAATVPAPSRGVGPIAATSIYPTPHAEYYSGGGGGDIGGGIGSVLSSIGSTALEYIPIIGPILGSLFGMFFGGSNTDQLAKAVKTLSDQVAQLGDNLTRFIWKVANGLGGLWQAIAETWDNFFDALWKYMKQLWCLLECITSKIIPCLIKVMRDMRKYLDWIYQHILKHMLNWIQKARKVLQILKALHVPFAAKLDRIIGQIQSAVFGPFLMLLQWFNTYGSWINTILSWDLTIQKPIFLRTMQKYQGDWINIWWNAQTGAGGAAAGQGSLSDGATRSWQQDQADFHQYVTTGTGPFAEVAAEAHQIFNDPTALV
jgi:hypothetical protein